MNRNKHKILVLSDLKENARDTLAYAITIAKEINGALELFCVKKPNDIVTTENQLSAVRIVNNEFVKTEQKAKNLARSIVKDNFFPVKNTIEFGSVKTEIENHINQTKPDLIIIGKRQKKLLSFNGDKITEFVLKKYTDKVLILGKNTLPEVYTKLNNKHLKSLTA